MPQSTHTVTAMVPIQLPVRVNLACRLLIKVFVRFAWVEQCSGSVPVLRRSARTRMPAAEVEHEILVPIAVDPPSPHSPLLSMASRKFEASLLFFFLLTLLFFPHVSH